MQRRAVFVCTFAYIIACCNRFTLSAAPGQQGTALRIASPAREAKKVRWAMPIAVFRAAALTFPSPRQT